MKTCIPGMINNFIMSRITKRRPDKQKDLTGLFLYGKMLECQVEELVMRRRRSW